jgi:hypothetical protein
MDTQADFSSSPCQLCRQVVLDVPRTAPSVPFFHEPPVQGSLERLLYIWGIRHPASGEATRTTSLPRERVL